MRGDAKSPSCVDCVVVIVNENDFPELWVAYLSSFVNK